LQCTVTWLDRTHTGSNIETAGGVSLAAALMSNTSLVHIDLSSNKIGPEGGRAIARVLKANTRVTYIDLSYNLIDIEACAAIADALHYNTHLKNLYLSGNPTGVEGGKAIAQVLSMNYSLLDVLIDEYDLGVLLNRNQALIWRNVHCRVLDVCLALAPLSLPTYVVLEIVDWLPPMSVAVWHHHAKKVQLIATVLRSCNER